MKTIAITGSNGFVGTNLKKRMTKRGYKVVGISREEISNQDKLIKIIEDSDYIVNLAGANIVNRWSEEYKKLLISSRINTTKALSLAISKANKKPELFISTSAVGIYKNSDIFDEINYEYEDDFLANLCKNWEKEALKVEEYGVRTAIFRFGIVLGNGGALKKMLTPFKIGLGGTISDGSQAVSFIHVEDLMNAYEFVIQDDKLNGIFNLTTPYPTTNKEMTKILGNILSRPTIFKIPAFVLKFIFSEGAKVLLDGQKILPKRLLDSGFKFQFKTINQALENLISD